MPGLTFLSSKAPLLPHFSPPPPTYIHSTTHILETWPVFEPATSEARGEAQPVEPQDLTPKGLLIKVFTFFFNFLSEMSKSLPNSNL